jgi:ABC-type lipoprotein release transport system permease subunit
MQKGSYGNMIKNSVESYSGYIQIHEIGYWENKSINKLLEDSDSLREVIKETPAVDYLIPRLETFALAATESLSKGVAVIGTDPQKENQMTHLQDKLVAGNYLTAEDNGILIAEGLSRYLNLGVNDTLVLLGQGYHGTNAVGKFPVSGILKLVNPQMNNNTVYMPLKVCQYYNGSPNKLTSLVLVVNSYDALEASNAMLKQKLGRQYEVMDWKELQPELVQLIQSDNAGGVIMLGILYMVIAFGIFGTIMMMTIERLREFGVLISIGMQKIRLVWLIFFETLLIGILGLLVSFMAGVPLLFYMHEHPIPLTGSAAKGIEEMGYEPIIPFSLEPSIFFTQGIAIISIVLLCLTYPYLRLWWLTPIESMK